MYYQGLKMYNRPSLSEIDQEFVVAGRYERGGNHVIAVYPTEQALNILYDIAEATKRN